MIDVHSERAPGVGGVRPGPKPEPNVLLVLLDDVGIEMLRGYDPESPYALDGVDAGAQLLYPETPTIDALIGSGVRFSQFRVAPVCSPTRASLYTGRYAFRHGVGTAVRADTVSDDLIELGVGSGPPETTIARVVQRSRYQAGLFGKWHLALDATESGVTEFPKGGVIWKGSGWDHLRDVGGWNAFWAIFRNLGTPPVPAFSDPYPAGYYNYFSNQNGTLETNFGRGAYATLRTRQKAQRWIAQTATEPFLAVVALNACHAPFHFPPAELVATDEYKPAVTAFGEAIPEGSGAEDVWRNYCAKLEAVDHELAELLDGLGPERRERTLVVLAGDNGTPVQIPTTAQAVHSKELGETLSFVAGKRRMKTTVFELGIRAPLVVSGAGVRQPGRVSHVLVDGVDLFATIRDLAGLAAVDVSAGLPLDGVSLRGVLRDPAAEAAHPRRFSFSETFQPNGKPESITDGRTLPHHKDRCIVTTTADGLFKLVRRLDVDDAFYHLYAPAMEAVDPFERVDLFPEGTSGEFWHHYLDAAAQLDALLAS